MDEDNISSDCLFHDVQLEEDPNTHLLTDQSPSKLWQDAAGVRLTMKIIQVTILAIRPWTLEGN